MVRIRQEERRDFDQIKLVNDLAFGQNEEGVLVGKLRLNPGFDSQLSLVAELNGEIVGHILFFPVKIINGVKAEVSLALAPTSVLPKYQRQGIGSKLITAGLARAKESGYNSVIVLGHPHYYPRFGFQPASKWNIRTHYEVPDDVFMAMELKKDSLKGVSGTVKYPNEFEEV